MRASGPAGSFNHTSSRAGIPFLAGGNFKQERSKGFDIEGLRIQDEQPRCKPVMAAPIAAITVQQLVHARDGKPHDRVLLEAYCRKLEGKTARQKNPHPKTSLAYAAWVCARLGGWTGYYGKPGPIVMLNGWLQFNAGKAAINALRSAMSV